MVSDFGRLVLAAFLTDSIVKSNGSQRLIPR